MRCTLTTQDLLEFIQNITSLSPASEPIWTRLALPRFLPAVDCVTRVTFAQTVAGPAEALERFVRPGSSVMTTRT